MERHKVLQRQLKRHQLSDTECPTNLQQWQHFLERINLAYENLDEDRYLSERMQVVSAKEMEELNRQLLIAARQTGMAEVATSILHNIGNVLNSLNVSIDLLSEKLKTTKLKNLEKITAMLKENRANLTKYLTEDEKGKHIIDYLLKLSDYWQEEYEIYLKELQAITKNIEHINTIVARQQALSGKSNIIELCDPIDILEDAVQISLKNLKQNITIIREFNIKKSILADRIKLHQIFVNLLNNAKDALYATDKAEKKIILSTDEDQKSIKIQITDNGIGIKPEDLGKIYAFGYTTKRSGHGFGLHASFLAAKEMNATLSAQSEGINKGTTFTLEFPMKEL